MFELALANNEINDLKQEHVDSYKTTKEVEKIVCKRGTRTGISRFYGITPDLEEGNSSQACQFACQLYRTR